MTSEKTRLKHCPTCGANTLDCKDSRPGSGDLFRWRRYRCASCGNRFTTHETIVTPESETEAHKRALAFVQGVEELARHHFGDEKGRFLRGGSGGDDAA